MATYCNQHWLLSHIRNSFISTDETGICETVMTSDDLPKHFLKKYQNPVLGNTLHQHQQHRKSGNPVGQRSLDPPLQEVDFVCYPGLDLSDDEDLDMTAQSFDIQMYPEIAHRFRSNTAQKLEKMDLARRKAARTKTVTVDDEIVEPERKDFFVKKIIKSDEVSEKENIGNNQDDVDSASHKSNNNESATDLDVKKSQPVQLVSRLSTLIANSPKQMPNKFIDYAKFDGTSQVGIQTKRINVFIAMLPEKERNYPIKICVIASAKISEVIGFVCYKATMQFPDLPLKSVRHYALYMTEDNDDMDDFPPLDNKEPCSKFGFSQLTLAERRPLATVTRLDYEYNQRKSFQSDEEKSRLAAEAVRSLQSIELNGAGAEDDNPNCISASSTDDHLNDLVQNAQSESQADLFDAPAYRTFRVHFIDKRFFKVFVTLGISGERLEIDHKNSKFWQKHRQATYPIESVAYCEITEKKNTKSVFRIWLKASSSPSVTACTGGGDKNASTNSLQQASSTSPTSPGFYPNLSSPFNFLNTSASSSNTNSHPMRFKHYDFEADAQTAEQIHNKLNLILESRNSEVRMEFMQRKLEKTHAKKQLKL